MSTRDELFEEVRRALISFRDEYSAYQWDQLPIIAEPVLMKSLWPDLQELHMTPDLLILSPDDKGAILVEVDRRNPERWKYLRFTEDKKPS